MERLMDLQLPEQVSREFEELLADEGHDCLDLYVHSDTFDEVPLYSRLTQVDFLGELPFAARNEALVRAAVRQQLKIIDRARVLLSEAAFREHLYLVSVTGWSDEPDEEEGGRQPEMSSGFAWDRHLLVPHFWVGNMGAEAMAKFAVQPGATAASVAVSAALGDDPAVGVYEGWATLGSEPVLRRVYVSCPQGYDVADRVRPL